MPRPKKKVEAKSKKKTKAVEQPLPEIAQEEIDNLRYIELINQIRRTEDEDIIDVAFEEILSKLKPRIQKIVNKFNIPGLDASDVFQESLYALRYKAIKDYDKLRGSGEGPASFERFAVLCIRRHLATEFKASFQNKKKVLNTAASLNQESNGNDEDLSLINIIPSLDGNVLHSIQRNELIRNFLRSLMQSLSGFEKDVFYQYANGDSYEEIARKINDKHAKTKRDVKSVDNALSRIKNKAKSIVDQNEEFKSLIPSKRRRPKEVLIEGDDNEVQGEGEGVLGWS